MPNDANDRQIGYGKPPTDFQWGKGTSGNNKGRPRGSKNTLTLLNKLANQEIKITQNGKPIKISKKAAAIMQALNKAAQGDVAALKTLMPHLLMADEKSERKDTYINFESSQFNMAIIWIVEAFSVAMQKTHKIDDETQRQVFVLLYQMFQNLFKEFDLILNDPKWTIDNSPPNPLTAHKIITDQG